MGSKVFIVDDDMNLIRLLESAFKSRGYEVKAFSTGKDAMAFLQDEAQLKSFNLFILDRMLGDIEGIEILKFIASKYQGGVPAIILSALSSEKDVLEGLTKGAADYLTKPFNIDVLMQKAEQIKK